MDIFYGTMTSKGQTTVPSEVRDILGLKAGDKIRYVHRDGNVMIRAKNKRAIDLLGKFHDPDRAPITVDEMNDGIGEAILGHLAGAS